jgi:ribosomal protein L44E
VFFHDTRTPAERTFQVNAQDARKLRQRKRRIRRRLKPRNFRATEKPVFAGTRPQYEMSGRVRCARAGGIGAIHAMAERIELVEGIDAALELLKVHLPYHGRTTS